ncbi:hypothetical protein [Amaricoccus macauensis]|uniref:hypothetical protein n=1 Tax=Amaricoccus macauensis TaxID=57001 RepID=UPI003C7E74EB
MKPMFGMAGAALFLAACAEGDGRAHTSGPAERACYNALANTHAFEEEITFVRTRRFDQDSLVTLQDSRGMWNCTATHDGHVTDLEPV